MANQMQTGKAFEYALLMAILKKVEEKHSVEITKNSSLENVKECFDFFDSKEQQKYVIAASKAVKHLTQLEPILVNSDIILSVQKDQKGRKGDPRDIIMLTSKKWEIGISAKNNNDMSVKSPRLSPKLDFGKDWFNVPCSPQYCQSIDAIFKKIFLEKTNNNLTDWKELKNKKDYYVEILDAFEPELCSLVNKIPSSAKILCQYIIGKYDYYLIMKFPTNVKINAINMNSTLNQSFGKIKASIKLKPIKFPTEIENIQRKSYNKIMITFDDGWRISFRLHNGSTKIQNSLKLEMKFEGLPPSLYSHQEPL